MPQKRCTVGVLARLAGVSPDSIRHYERIGILPRAERTRSGYRVWDMQVVQYLKWLGPARGAGFTLRELAEVFRMYRTGVPPCRAVRDILDQKLIRLSAQIEELSTIHSELKRVLTQWNRKLRQSPPGEFVPLFDDLDHRPPLQIEQAFKQTTKRRKPHDSYPCSIPSTTREDP
ncbi:MAG: MerR family DNA-binding transcriptional regulator [Nitrospiria bacterium]